MSKRLLLLLLLAAPSFWRNDSPPPRNYITYDGPDGYEWIDDGSGWMYLQSKSPYVLAPNSHWMLRRSR
jgi:hypothetical protein